MATSTIQRGNKSKKQGSSNNGKYVYNMGGPGSKPEPLIPESIKKVIPTNPRGLMGLGSLIRSKTYRERTIHEVKKDYTHVAKVEETMAVKSRKSVAWDKSRSSVSEAEIMAAKSRKSVSELSGRSSVSELMSVKVLVSDMPGFMQVHAFRCARASYDGLETFSAKHIAFNIKKEFDKVYGPAWHCIVGSSFGSFVTHSTGGFLYFSMENLYILVFKTKVQKALHYS